jgi:hypothetical protein
MATIGDLHALADALLTASAEALDTVNAYDATLQGAQDRQFVSPGTPVLDCCDQLTVHIPSIAQGDTTPGGLAAGKRHLTGAINIPTFHITSTRCIPVGSTSASGDFIPPSAASLGEAARQLNADAWALWNHLFWLQASDMLLNLCSEVFFDGIQELPPSGGCAGWLAQVRASLDGYQVSFST